MGRGGVTPPEAPLDDLTGPTAARPFAQAAELAAMLRRWRELRADPDAEVLDEERLDELWRAPPRPYPGLRAFAPDESNVFFARERETLQLIERLGRSSVVVVLGGSGSGKSSLVRAGLVPRLAAGAQVPGRPGGWYTVEIRPGEDPNAELIRGLCKGLLDPVLGPHADPARGLPAARALLGTDEAGSADELRERAPALLRERLFDEEPGGTLRSARLDPRALFALALNGLDGFDAALRGGLRVGRPNLLILLDQFEEAFRPGVDPRGQLNLCELLMATAERQPPGLFIAVTMRSEETHRATESGLADVLNGSAFHVGPLDREEDAHSIVFCPAQAVLGDWLPAWREAASSPAAPFSEAVVRALSQESRRLLRGDVRGSDHLPLLQHALSHLWDAAAERWERELAAGQVGLEIAEADLRAACGGGEALLTDCLELHADRAYDAARAAALRELAGKAGARERAEALSFAALCSLARRDDRNNWARRFTFASRIARLASADGSADPVECRAATAFLQTLHWHGYLNRMAPPPGGEDSEALFDVSHEALIRCWSRLREDVLPRAEQVATDLYDVDRNLEAEMREGGWAADASHGRKPRLPIRLRDWFTEVRERQACEIVPDRLRATLNAVLAPRAPIPRELAAQLLEEEARHRGTSPPGGGTDARAAGRARLRRMEEPWRVVTDYSRRWVSRPVMVTLLIPGLVAGLVVFVVLLSKSEDARQATEARESALQITHLAVDVLGQLGRGLRLDVAAGEVLAAHSRLEELRRLVEARRDAVGARRDAIGGRPSGAELRKWTAHTGEAAFNGAGRQVSEAETDLLRRVNMRVVGRSEAQLREGGTACASVDGGGATPAALLREVAGWQLGLRWSAGRSVLEPAAGRPGAAEPHRADDLDGVADKLPRRDPSGSAAGAVCLSADATLLMSWPAPTDTVREPMPSVLGLRWYCAGSDAGECTRWGVRLRHPGQPAIADLAWGTPAAFEQRFGSARERVREGGGIYHLPEGAPRLRAGFVVVAGADAAPLVIDAGRELAGVGLIPPAPQVELRRLDCPAGRGDEERPLCEDAAWPDWRLFLTRASPNEASGGDGQHFRFFLNVTDARGYPLAGAEFHAGRIEQVARERGRLLLVDHHGVWRVLTVARRPPAERLAPLDPRLADPRSPDPRVRSQTPACTDYDCTRWIPDDLRIPAAGTERP